MASKPVQRSLAHLRANGWTVCIVEKWIPARGSMKFGIRLDAFHIGDLLACRPRLVSKHWDGNGQLLDSHHITENTIALVQCCSTDFAKHKEKILGIPEFAVWKAAGGEVILHSWVLKGPRGKRKTYQLREEFL
jgi:hypothetical protein